MPGSEEAEVYDPVDDTWTRVEDLNKPRKTPASVVLSDGSVMVIGGLNPDDVPFSSTKIFSPSARTWVDGPLMIVARGTPVAAPLGDGRVIAVDWLGSAERPTSEIYDPARGTWEPGLAFPERVDITALLALAGGSFLAIGDDFSGSDPGHIALMFDGGLEAATRVQSPQGSRYTLLALPDGDALAVGGMDSDLGGDGGTIGWIQRFSVASARWETVATLATPRLASQAVVLGDGRVLIAGGSTGDDFEPATEVLATSEIFDPATDTVEAGPLLLEPRRAGYAVALPDGTVLLVGGDAQLDPGETPFCPTPLKTVERFWPGA
jgi:hypothetical protein